MNLINDQTIKGSLITFNYIRINYILQLPLNKVHIKKPE